MTDDDVRDRMGEAVRRLQESWETGSGAELRDFVPPANDAHRRAVLIQLIKTDQQHRWNSGDHRVIEEYLGDFPELRSGRGAMVELLCHECCIRTDHGEEPQQNELRDRFPDLVDEIDQWFSIDEATSFDTVNSTQPGTPVSPKDQQKQVEQWRRIRGAILGLSPGDQLSRYEILEMIGKGGMGQVYKAKDPTLGRLVAIKIPRNDLSDNPEILGRFRRELEAMAALDHPNICTVYDAQLDVERKCCFIVMALIAGETLEARLENEIPETSETIRLVIKIARALEAAHAAGVVHRDVKPGNVLMNGRNEPQLTDFGLCGVIEPVPEYTPSDTGVFIDETGSRLVGTPGYMSPEQASRKPATHLSDIFSLGVMLYRMLTGKLPFSGSAYEVISQVAVADPPRLLDHCPDLSPELQDILSKAMARDPADRYQSAGEFAAVLEEFAAAHSQPTPAPRRATFRTGTLLALIMLAVAAYPTWTFLRNRIDGQNGGGRPGDSADPEPATRTRPGIVKKELEPVSSTPGEVTETDYEVKVINQQLDQLANIEKQLWKLRELESDYCQASATLLAKRDQKKSVSDRAKAKYDEIKATSGALSLIRKKEKDLLEAVEDRIRNPGRDPEELYVLVRTVAEALDKRRVLLEAKRDRILNRRAVGPNDLETVQAISAADDPMAARVANQLANVRNELLELEGVGEEIDSVRELKADYDGARKLLRIRTRKGFEVKVRALAQLTRLNQYDLSASERALLAKAREPHGNALSRPEEVYPDILSLVDHVDARQRLLGRKRARLKSWSSDSKSFAHRCEMLPEATQRIVDEARIQFALGNHQQAIAEIGKGLGSADTDAVLTVLRGRLYVQAGQFPEAIRDAERAIALDAECAYAYCVRGLAHLRQRQLDDAMRDANRAMQHDPKTALATGVRAGAYFDRSDHDHGIPDMEKAVVFWLAELEADDSGAQWTEDPDFAMLLQMCSRAISSVPESATGYFCRGRLHLANGAAAPALSDFSAAIERAPDVVEYQEFKARAMLLQGDADKTKQREPHAQERA